MKYELDVLAAIMQYQYPNIKLIVDATGISERKVQLVIKSLGSDLGMDIKRTSRNNSFYFSVNSWGVFESGSTLREHLDNIDLIKSKAKRLRTKKCKISPKTDAQKAAYYDSVKLENYKDSLRLEGFDTHALSSPSKESDRQKIKEDLLNSYKIKADQQAHYAR